MFKPVKKYLPGMTIIAKNNKVKKYFDEKGIKYTCMPAFPKVVIMARQTPYKFPVDKIIKFGIDHGLYQFKRWTSPEHYNGFNIYFVSSDVQAETAKKLGITTVQAIGYPKLDNAFNGEYDEKLLNRIRSEKNINPGKKTIIFTSTWDVAGLSALTRWIDKIDSLTSEYNILVTVHTWTLPKYITKLKSIKGVTYLDEYDVTPYLMIADVLVGDYNSLIGEFCAFDKPIITFQVPESDRTIPEILTMLESISIRINNFGELHGAIKRCIQAPNAKTIERKKANKILFSALDGKAGKRAAEKILESIQ
jgi:CDP-glycerol glycerophosphotransferase (TagB/SpsB family)